MGWNDLFLRVFACVLLIPLIGAALAYWRSQSGGALLWNAALLVLVLSVSAIEMLVNQTQITAGGLLYAIPPMGALAACTAGYLRRSRNPLLFWFPWSVNVAIVTFLFYLAFWFHISF